MHCISHNTRGVCPSCGYCPCCGRVSRPWQIAAPIQPWVAPVRPLIFPRPVFVSPTIVCRPDPVVRALAGKAA